MQSWHEFLQVARKYALCYYALHKRSLLLANKLNFLLHLQLARLAEAGQTFTKSDGKVCRLQLPEPVMLQPGKFYMLSALVKGPESYCGEDCLETVVVGGVRVTFQCWESPNGTNEQRGQFPELYIRVLNSGI